MITPDLQKEIEIATKGHITSIQPLSSANNALIYRLNYGDERILVAKLAETGLEAEAFMINYLRTKSRLPVPNIHYFNPHLIIMDFIEPEWHVDDGAQRNAAEHLSELHKIRGEKYGFERDTVFGTLLQPNPQMSNWAEFFVNNRLLYMAKEALKEGKIDAKMMKQLEKIAVKAEKALKNPAPPSLIHGDVWGGNVLAGKGKILAFLDPALYYADPEIELAFASLSETFGRPFFERYNELSPIKAGFFEERRDIYNLYPLLANARMFGSSYVRKIQKVLNFHV